MVSADRPSGVTLLLQTLEGPIRHAVLDWALESGVFDLCRTPAPPDLLGQGMGLPVGSLTLALRALSAAGFMECLDGGFRTAPDILPFVAADGPRNMVETLRMMARTRHGGLDAFGAMVAGAALPPGSQLFDAAHWDAHHRSLVSFHRAIAAEAMAPCMTGLPEWGRTRTLLEIGPGSAVLAERLLAQRPDLRVTLFDLPQVAERIRQDAPDPAITILSGDYNRILPEGHFDLIWCSMTLYFHDAGLPTLIARLADLLVPGGVLVSFHEALNGDRTRPPEHVLGRLMPALRQGDVSFGDGEIAAAMAAAGLTGATAETLATPFGRFRLDAARRKA
ncbi:class I SAM-dependent methyltransferase [Pseudogemmobacter sonorensis]|uniref:class I SAM-dependent methyltransferase n=1 Tax=Pseudogemmobacter sonorensis TaxID=2989681 RepID=UPI0036B1B1A1